MPFRFKAIFIKGKSESNLMNKKEILIISIIIINLVLSLYLVYTNSKSGGICIIGESCSEVQSSEYGKIFGISLSKIGVISFAVLLVIYFLKERYNFLNLIFSILTIIGGLFALYFLSIQAFILKQFCSTCIVIDILAIILPIVVLSQKEKKSSSSTPPHLK